MSSEILNEETCPDLMKFDEAQNYYYSSSFVHSCWILFQKYGYAIPHLRVSGKP